MARFRPNRNLARDLARDAEYRKGLADAAEPARDLADTFARQAGAPWMPRKGTQDVTVIDTSGGQVRIIATDHGGHLREFGSANNPPHAPLRRGVRAAGLRLDEHGKAS